MPGAYLAINNITDGAAITVSSENSGYPKQNLYDKKAPFVFRCESQTLLTVEIDFNTAIQMDTLALINHNLTAGASLTLKADNSSPPTTTRATPAYRQYDIWAGFTAVSARYWLLSITDSNTDYLQIGQMLLGTRVVFPRGRRIANRYSPAMQRENIGGETYAGVMWKYHLFERRQLNPSFRISGETELEKFTDLDAAVYGDNFPFLYIPNVSSADCYYMRKEKEFRPAEIELIGGGNIAYDIQLKLTEESRGLEILE